MKRLNIEVAPANSSGAMGQKLICLILLFFIMAGFAYSQAPKGKVKAITITTYSITTYSRVVCVGYVYKNRFEENQNMVFFRENSSSSYTATEKNGEFFINKKPISDFNPHLSGKYFTKDGVSYMEGVWDKTNDWWSNRNNGWKQYTVKGLFQFSTELTPVPGNGIPSFKTIDATSFHAENSYGAKFYEEKKPNGKYSLKIEFGDRTLECETSKSVTVSENVLENVELAKITYKDGCIFVGKINNDGTPTKGEMKFPTGEIYNGNITPANRGMLAYYYGNLGYYDGEMTFTDGTKANGYWLTQYELRGTTELQDIYSRTNGPTEVRNLAKSIYEERQQELQAANKAKEEAQQRAKIAEQQKQQQRKRELTAKYGAETAEDIIAGIIKIGMSKEVCKEIIPRYRVVMKTAAGEQWEVAGFFGGATYYTFVNDKLAMIER
jgi:hypothetical protein